MAASAEAAADRARQVPVRLAQLRARLDRLERGEPCTAEDVERARQRASDQVESYVLARERMLATRRLIRAHRRRSAGSGALDGVEPAVSRWDNGGQRPSGGGYAHAQPTQRLTSPGSAVRSSDQGTTGAAGVEVEMARLRSGLAAMLAWAGDPDPDELPARRVWCEGIVRRCGSSEWQGWAHAVCEQVAATSPAVRGAAICLVGPDHGVQLAAASDRETARLQELEFIVGEGPTTTAHRNLSATLVGDLSGQENEWPMYGAAVAGYDLHGVTVLPVRTQGATVGSLTLYGSDSGRLEAAATAAFVDLAAAAVLADFPDPGESSEGLVDDGWYAFYIAAGALATRLEVSLNDAMSRLRAHAFVAGLTLAQVAEQALAGRLDLS